MSLVGRLRPRPPDGPFLEQCTRFFFSGIVEERATHLARIAGRDIAELRQSVFKQYGERLQDALAREAQFLAQGEGRLQALAELEKLFPALSLPHQLSDRDFASRPRFAKLVGRARSDWSWRGRLHWGPLGRYRSAVIAAVVLRAVEGVALRVVSDDYAIAGRAAEVPETASSAITELLARLAAYSARIRPDPPLKPLERAKTELSVLVARAEGRLWLPLRPIPTGPLADDGLTRHYVGRPAADACRLARQIRHADGTILITGYRGVGKSSFVNRVVYELQQEQAGASADSLIVVPVSISLAKVSGVQAILRLTLRALREALLDPARAEPRAIPGTKDRRLPLLPDEISRLQEAYIRATWKVAFSRSHVIETKWEVGSSVSFDPGKALHPLAGWELGKLFSASAKRSRAEKVNRELSLLDYDENAAEDDLAALIRSLATPRPLSAGGPQVRLKPLIVYDELDKMDLDTGLRPMIEGLKNLFLQPNAVFMLVTSKQLYYSLLKDRAVEDARLSSYFSEIVHVPLLTFAQVRDMLEHWIDLEGLDALNESEARLLDQLARFLTYRSFGNPRDIIRELRHMQEWAGAGELPCLTERLSRLPELPLFAAVQEAIELVGAPRRVAAATAGAPGEAALASERLIGDEARLEQVRRGLYILSEEIINRQTLPVDASALEPLQRDNFSLLSVADVQQLANRLGSHLASLHTNLPVEAFAPLTPGQAPQRVPLFVFETQPEGIVLKATNEFYALSGRQAALTQPASSPVPLANRSDEELIKDAEALAEHAGWAERLSAIAIIGQLGPAKLTPSLRSFLLHLVAGDADPSHRLAAAERLTPEMVLGNPAFDLPALLLKEKDERLLSIYIRLLGAVSDEQDRGRATDALLTLLKDSPGGIWSATVNNRIVDMLAVLQTIANRDITTNLLEWLCAGQKTDVVTNAALRTLGANADRFQVDLADRILSKDAFLLRFLAARPRSFRGITDPARFQFLMLDALKITLAAQTPESFLKELIAKRPTYCAGKLLQSSAYLPVDGLLAHVWEAGMNANEVPLARLILDEALKGGGEAVVGRLAQSLRLVPEYQTRLFPWLESAWKSLADQQLYTTEACDQARKFLASIKSLPAPRFTLNPGLFTSPARTPFSLPTDRPFLYTPEMTGRRAAALALSLVPFACAMFLFRGDVPAGATLGTIFLSRLLILLAHASVLVPMLLMLADVVTLPRDVDAMRWTSKLRETHVAGIPLGVLNSTLPLLLFAFYDGHRHSVGPVTFWNQVLLFVLNLATVLLAAYGLRPFIKLEKA